MSSRTKLPFALAAGLALAAFGPIPAAHAAPAPNDDADQSARIDDQTYIFVEGDELDGEVLRPIGTHVQRRPGTRHPSLIKLRVSFSDRLEHHTRDM